MTEFRVSDLYEVKECLLWTAALFLFLFNLSLISPAPF